jgi:hypothetical protein
MPMRLGWGTEGLGRDRLTAAVGAGVSLGAEAMGVEVEVSEWVQLAKTRSSPQSFVLSKAGWVTTDTSDTACLSLSGADTALSIQ